MSRRAFLGPTTINLINIAAKREILARTRGLDIAFRSKYIHASSNIVSTAAAISSSRQSARLTKGGKAFIGHYADAHESEIRRLLCLCARYGSYFSARSSKGIRGRTKRASMESIYWVECSRARAAHTTRFRLLVRRYISLGLLFRYPSSNITGSIGPQYNECVFRSGFARRWISTCFQNEVRIACGILFSRFGGFFELSL